MMHVSLFPERNIIQTYSTRLASFSVMFMAATAAAARSAGEAVTLHARFFARGPFAQFGKVVVAIADPTSREAARLNSVNILVVEQTPSALNRG
jgi:hypothetical protein